MRFRMLIRLNVFKTAMSLEDRQYDTSYDDGALLGHHLF